nr:reverse transcriptase domain-containing protein [Tanacetum cinerariifolium]
ASTEGYGEAIVILEILAENFKIKTNLLQLVQANKFHGRENDNHHTHISNFKRMTATLKYRDVSNDAIKLMLFSYSLEDRARIWYEKEPPNLILTWDDLVNKFVDQFFPPSKTTHLKNEISRFTQRFEETFSEAWDHFKEMLRACPHHGFSELTQIDTFYNGLTEQDQDSLNAASSGNLLNKTTREALQIIENKSKVCYSRSKSNVSRVNTNSRDVVSKTDDQIDKLADQISNLVEIVNKQVIAPAKAVEKSCVTCRGAHAYYECIATDSNPSIVCAATCSYNQVSPPNRASHQIPPPGFASVQNNPNRFNQATIPRRSNRRRIPNIVEPEIQTIAEIVPMADRTMEELLQEPTKGYGEAIVIPEILGENFEIKINLLQLVQANKFPGFERDNPHAHISNFKRMTATLKHKDVPNDAIKLMLFSYSLEGATRIWDVVSKTDDIIDKLADQISNLVKIVNKQVIAPAKAVEKTCVTCGGAHAYYECIATDSNPSSFCAATGSFNQVSPPNELVTKFHYLVLFWCKIIQIGLIKVRGITLIKQIISIKEIISGETIFRNNQSYRAQINNALNFQNQGFQNQPFSVLNNQIPPSVPNEFLSYLKSNEIMIKSMQNQINVLRGGFNKQEENLRRNLNDDMRSILGSFFQNQPSTSGTLPSNTVSNLKGEMKAVTTRIGLAYEGPSIPTESPLEKVDEQNTKEILDKEHSNSSGSTAQVQPPVVPILILKPDVMRTQKKPTIPYPSRLNEQKLREKATNQMEKFFQIFHDLHFDISFADALLLMPKFASTIKSLLVNKDKLFELAKVPLNENYSAMLLKKLPEKLGDLSKFLIPCDFPRMEVCHALADLGTSINLMPLSIWKKLSLSELTATRMTLKLADRSITHPKGVADDVFFKVGKFHFPTDFVVVDFKADPRVPLILGRSFLRTGRALINVYGEEITLWVNDESITFMLNQTIRYSSTYDDTLVNRVDVIDIACEDFVQDVLDF